MSEISHYHKNFYIENINSDCNINFNDLTILSKDSNNINLLIKESLLIARDKPILNKTVKSFPIELFE